MNAPRSGAAEQTWSPDSDGGELSEMLEGLGARQKTLSPKFFYDERGSQLFDEICRLPEYYPTRSELAIMHDHADDMAERIGPRACVIELGSGSSLKTRVLLKHLEEPVAYVPVDISAEHLLAAADSLAADFPALEVLPVVADFTRPFPVPAAAARPVRNLIYFPGSTLGNFTRDEALGLLRVMHAEAGPGGALLIGIDLRKDPRILERAYNDSTGVTAEFNLNMLRRINREFGADFDPEGFTHEAVWDAQHDRIEMRLVARNAQSVHLAGHLFSFRQGEFIITEYSHKYSLTAFATMASKAGFSTEKVWTDPDRLFSVHLCRRED